MESVGQDNVDCKIGIDMEEKYYLADCWLSQLVLQELRDCLRILSWLRQGPAGKSLESPSGQN